MKNITIGKLSIEWNGKEIPEEFKKHIQAIKKVAKKQEIKSIREAEAKQRREDQMLIEQNRKEKGITLQEIADKIQVTKQTVHKWEKGKSPISKERLNQINRVLNG